MNLSKPRLAALACIACLLQIPSVNAAVLNSSAKPTVVATMPPLDPAAASALTPAQIVQKANAWFNSAVTMECDFIQLGPDGRRTHGKLYVQRPGRLRFQYASPATLEVIADGTSVAVYDRKLATQTVYFISQTPLKFLLKDPIDLARDTKILKVESDPDSVSIFIEDKTTFGGTSHIRLFFDPKTFALQQWSIIDPQGYQTLVSLFNIDLKTKPDPSLFHIRRIVNNDE